MPGHVRQRWLLIGSLIAAQLLVLFAATVLFERWLARELRSTVRERVLDASLQTAGQIVGLIEMMDLNDLTPGSDDWRRLQDVVERTSLPHGGFLCVIDRDTGRILCHPQLAQQPELAQRSLSDMMLSGPHAGTPLSELSDAGGWLRTDDGNELIVVRDLDSANAKVLLHQREDQLNRTVLAFVGRARAIVWVVAVIVVMIGAVLTMLIVRRYENRLERANATLEQKVEQRGRELVRSRDAVIFGMAKLAESRDDETGQHLDRICRYAEVLAAELADHRGRVDGADVHTLAATAALHDIGKVAIPDAILRKPGPLTDDERRVMQKHPYLGGDTLMELRRRWSDDPFLLTASQIAFAHHERWDGKGYPFGIGGEDIPLAARIVAVADVYDAITSRRSYKPAMSHEHARRSIVEGSGAQFDPAVVEAFLAVERRFEQVRRELG